MPDRTLALPQTGSPEDLLAAALANFRILSSIIPEEHEAHYLVSPIAVQINQAREKILNSRTEENS